MEEDKTDANAEVQTGTDLNGAETDRGGHGEWEVDAAGLQGGWDSYSDVLSVAGYFGLVSLSTDPRWRSHSIYLFGVDMYGNMLFTGNPYNWGMGMSPSELTTIAARNDVAVAEAFG